eukprot:3103856-Rhodomonas_salina.1
MVLAKSLLGGAAIGFAAMATPAHGFATQSTMLRPSSLGLRMENIRTRPERFTPTGYGWSVSSTDAGHAAPGWDCQRAACTEDVDRGCDRTEEGSISHRSAHSRSDV